MFADPRCADPLLDAPQDPQGAHALHRGRRRCAPRRRLNCPRGCRRSLRALATEAADGRQLLMDLERVWFAARSAVAGRRRDSHAAAAVDVLAAVPFECSATSLAAGASASMVKSAIRLLDGLLDHRLRRCRGHPSRKPAASSGLKGMALLGDAVQLLLPARAGTSGAVG